MIDITIGEEPPQKRISRTPNCLTCEHLSITWNNNFPYACDIFPDDIYRMLPSVVVLNATGRMCPSFKLKSGIQQ
ncbi:MAG: hypothetical protein LBT01_01435 [Spirochaetaceae bacterium]|nr:hypothetical protein [Spirochaetaceae bacterium]